MVISVSISGPYHPVFCKIWVLLAVDGKIPAIHGDQSSA